MVQSKLLRILGQTILGHINYNDNITSRLIRVYIKWDDSENSNMNNLADTQATLAGNNASLLNVTVSFIQTTQ